MHTCYMVHEMMDDDKREQTQEEKQTKNKEKGGPPVASSQRESYYPTGVCREVIGWAITQSANPKTQNDEPGREGKRRADKTEKGESKQVYMSKPWP